MTAFDFGWRVMERRGWQWCCWLGFVLAIGFLSFARGGRGNRFSSLFFSRNAPVNSNFIRCQNKVWAVQFDRTADQHLYSQLFTYDFGGGRKCLRGFLNFELTLNIFVLLLFVEIKIKHLESSPAYNHTLATIIVEYASAGWIWVLQVYVSDLMELFTWTCKRCHGKTEGFEVIELIVDIKHCLQAFVGVDEDLNAIVIAFRGTHENSIQNWIDDLYWKQLDLNYPDMPDAMVHHGFYFAYHNTTMRTGILNAVEKAKEFYGDISIIVTGHSMGGAMAAFCGLDLTVNGEAQDVQVITFGQPRIGNAIFSTFYSQLVPNTIRVTNGHDIVPHLPPYYRYFPQKTYHHFPKEVWLYNVNLGSLVYTVEKVCDKSGEDPSCSRSVAGNSIADHLVYFGVELMGGGDLLGSCKIVADPRMMKYGGPDAEGNIVLSRTPIASAIRLKVGNDERSKIF